MALAPNSHRLFWRTWRSTCPIRPRHSALRRWSGISLLAVLCLVIVGYAFITDSDRVREQAETYLARLVGGPVYVQSASLSLFEGLRLEGVTILTHEVEGEQDADAVFFTARSVSIDYSPLQLLTGRISAQSIIAVDPHVRIVENVDGGTWNFQKLQRPRPTGAPTTQFVPPEELPQILLRNARVELIKILTGQVVARKDIGIEAQLLPALNPEGQPLQDHSYRFSMQTLGLSAGEAAAGPRARGIVNLDQGSIRASLEGVDFTALMDLLPRAAAQWCDQHAISGKLRVPQFELNWNELVTLVGPGGIAERVPRFRAVVRLEEAQMQGLPEEWLPADEIAARGRFTRFLEGALTRAKSPRTRRIISEVMEHTTLRPLRLRDVSGSFVFTHSGLRVNGFEGQFEGNRIRVDGIVDGYSTDAAISLVVHNAGDAITLEPDLPYVGSLPRQVREIYQRFTPVGRCRMRLELHRPAASADGAPVRPVVTGYIDVLEGTFKLDRFPYPVRNARGRLLLRYDRLAQQDQLLIENLRGLGIAGGPNEQSQMTINGTVGPLTSHAGFDITVAGTNVSNEPALIAALPEAARDTIAAFDPARHGKGVVADGTSLILSFGGDFVARVMRPPGPRQRWDFQVDLRLREMNGAFEAFPYPLVDATGNVTVFRDHVEIREARTSRQINAEAASLADADVSFSGNVYWDRRAGDPAGPPPIRVDLNVLGENVPTDAAMLGALPPKAVEQLSALGVGGVADFSARVFTDEKLDLRWDVGLDLKDGRFWPETGTFNLSDARGRVRILPERVELAGLTGRRGDGTLTIDGSVELNEGGVSDARVSAKGVTLDAATYDLLPLAAKDAWNWLRPAGTTDAVITYRGPTALLWGSDEERVAAAQGAEPEYEVLLRPQGASALPQSFPYALQNVRGEIKIVPGRIEITELTADHVTGDNQPTARLALTGNGELGSGEDDRTIWRLRPKITNAPLDEALLTALPQGLRKTIESLSARGMVSAEFQRLDITTHPVQAAPVPPASAPASAEALSTLDVDFAVQVTTADASLDAGAPLTGVQGSLSVSGKYRRGELDELAGAFAAEHFTIRGRSGKDLSGILMLPSGSDVLTIDNIEAQLAEGQLAGSSKLFFGQAPDEPTRYSVQMAVREADIRQLIGEQPGRAADFSGHMTARLDLEGTFDQPASRRGRGEVIVQGQKLYDLPLVLGLLQVTTLALPLAEPFKEASAGFSIDGQKVIFDRIALQAADMTMTGQGTLNFETQKVDLSFTTSSASWAAIPLLGDFMGVARNELLRINVRGTLQSPEVSGSTLPTITSTIDEVLRRD